MSAIAALRAYGAHPDPATRIANSIVLLVGLYGPFYPAYVWFLLPEAGPAALATMAMSPAFLAIPWLSTRRPSAGRSSRSTGPRGRPQDTCHSAQRPLRRRARLAWKLADEVHPDWNRLHSPPPREPAQRRSGSNRATKFSGRRESGGWVRMKESHVGAV